MSVLRKKEKEKMLTQTELKELLHYDPATGIFTCLVPAANNKVKVGDVAGALDFYGYRRIKIKSKSYKAHRLAWLYVHGRWPKAEIDHINHVRNDNRLANLREATTMQNGTNRNDNTSGAPGVHWYKTKSKWCAQIQVAGKKKHLGYFDSIEDAAEARRAAELKYFGVNAL